MTESSQSTASAHAEASSATAAAPVAAHDGAWSAQVGAGDSKLAAIRVLLADDHAVLLESLALYLRQHSKLNIVGAVRHGDAIAKAIVELQPHVLVMDLSMPGADAYQRLQQVKRVSEGRVATLILTSDLGGYEVNELLRAGARGYLPKHADGKQLVAAIEALHGGNVYLYGDIESLTLHPNHQSQAYQEAEHREGLSKREMQLLNLMAKGCSNKEISERLFLSLGTIKSYSSRMFDKLAVRDRTQAVLLAMQNGLLPKQR